MAAIRGQPGDGWADNILGQPGFGEIGPYLVDPSRSRNGGGCVVDRDNRRMYVFDGPQNRILGLDMSQPAFSAPDAPNWIDGLGAVAQKVIGQLSLYTSAANGDSAFQNYPIPAAATARSLASYPEDVGSVGEAYFGCLMSFVGGALYVTDLANNRGLMYSDPWQDYPAADEVWGQADFTSRLPNRGQPSPSASSLWLQAAGRGAYMAGIDVDSDGNVWIADPGNNRVLSYRPGQHEGYLVLGQDDFTHGAPGSGLNRLNTPLAVRVSPYTGYVYVADSGNYRFLRFKPPFTNGMSGEVFGSVPAKGNGPSGVDFSPFDVGKVWLTNRPQFVVELWDEGTGLLVRELGWRDVQVVQPYGSMGFAANGDIYVTDGMPFRFRAGGPTDFPRCIFGGANAVSVPWPHSPAKLEGTTGLAVQDGQAIVATWGRIHIWDDPASLSDYKPADKFAGGDGAISNFNEVKYGGHVAMRGDKAHHHIWVSVLHDGPPHISVYSTPMAGGDQPTKKLYPPFNAVGGGLVPSSDVAAGLCISPDGRFLWVAYPDTNRVLRIREPLGDSPLVDVILGQRRLDGGFPNQGGPVGPDTLMCPGTVALDRLGNVWVSDHANEGRGNYRLLMFPAPLFPPDTADVIFAPRAAKIIPNVATYEVAFDSKNQMIVTYSLYGPGGPRGGRFVSYYRDPLGPTTVPDGFLSDYGGAYATACFDEQDNLYVGDSFRSRVLVYRTPLAASPEPPPPPSAPAPVLDHLTISPSSLRLRRGDSSQLVATAYLTDGSSYDATSLVAWSSLNETICTVTAGLVRTLRRGRATVVASLDDEAGFCSVRVTG